MVLHWNRAQAITCLVGKATHIDSFRADSRLVPGHWETSLQSNAVSHWLGANLESALLIGYLSIIVTWHPKSYLVVLNWPWSVNTYSDIHNSCWCCCWTRDSCTSSPSWLPRWRSDTIIWHSEAWTKWLTFSKQYFQMHFLFCMIWYINKIAAIFQTTDLNSYSFLCILISIFFKGVQRKMKWNAGFKAFLYLVKLNCRGNFLRQWNEYTNRALIWTAELTSLLMAVSSATLGPAWVPKRIQ